MSNMEEMTADEFDARLDASEPVEVVVRISKSERLYTVGVTKSAGYAAAPNRQVYPAGGVSAHAFA